MALDFGPLPQLVVILSGPAGVGKDALIAELKRQGFPIHFTITATSRPPRAGEIDGVHYFFFCRPCFRRLIDRKYFLEYSLVHKQADHAGDYYGVPRSQIDGALAAGRDVIVKPDVQGATKLRAALAGRHLVSIFLAPETVDQLVHHMIGRDPRITPDEIERRLLSARDELARSDEFDYLVVNREGALDRSVETVKAIILAEKHRVGRRAT